jgi:hypothetical protein
MAQAMQPLSSMSGPQSGSSTVYFAKPAPDVPM